MTVVRLEEVNLYIPLLNQYRDHLRNERPDLDYRD